MINPVLWELRCEETGCEEGWQDDDWCRLHNDARARGWQFHVKLNGEVALRGGKDYCPTHRKGER